MDARMARLLADEAPAVAADGRAGRRSGFRRRAPAHRAAPALRVGRRWALVPARRRRALRRVSRLGGGPTTLRARSAPAARDRRRGARRPLAQGRRRARADRPLRLREAAQLRLPHAPEAGRQGHVRGRAPARGRAVDRRRRDGRRALPSSTDDRPTFPTPEDKADYEASPARAAVRRTTPRRRRGHDRRRHARRAEVRALPTDPATLRARIEGGDVDADRDGRPAAGDRAHAARGQGRAVRGAQGAARARRCDRT